MRVHVEATILQAFSYSETSRILRLLTAEHGVQSVIAKGARRPKSRYGGILEPFTDGVASFSLRENRDLHTLSDFELVRSRQALGRDLVGFGGASLLAEIVLRTASQQPAPEIFHHVRQAFDALQAAPSEAVEAVALAQVWSLIAILGFAPALDRCVGCGEALGGGDLFFDYSAGGLHCGACGSMAGSGRLLPESARRDLVSFCQAEPVDAGRTGAHWQLLARFLAYHLVDARSLRSLEFLAAAVEDA